MSAFSRWTNVRRKIAVVAVAGLASTTLTALSPHAVAAASRASAAQAAAPYAAWGGNSDGELGDGTYTDQQLPESVTLAQNVDPVAVAAGGAFSLAIGSDSQLYSWGNNTVGELGNGTASSTGTAAGDGQDTPKPISLSSTGVPVAVSAGRESAIALDSTGHMWTWGYNAYGDLGDGTNVDRHAPVPVALPGGDLAGSVDAGNDSMAAVGVDGKVFTWGYTAYDVLGRDTGANAPADVPVQIAIPGDDPVRQVSLSEARGLAVGTDGKLFSWGYTYVGDGTSDSQPAPVQISLPGGIRAVAVAAGDDNDMVLGGDGRVYTWGSDEYGGLGDGGPSTKVQLSPEPVTLPGGDPATAIADGGLDSYAVGQSGGVYSWGFSFNGLALGNGGPDSNTPQTIHLPGSAPAVTIAAGTDDVLVTEPTKQRAPVFVADTPPSLAAAGRPYDYGFYVAATPSATFTLAPGAPAWLSINAATGEVSGTVPADSTSFSFAVTATNSLGTATTPSFTVAIGPPLPYNGHVKDSGGAPAVGALAQLCGSSGCQRTTTDSSGAFAFTEIAQDHVQLTVYPPTAEADRESVYTQEPAIVPPGGVADQEITLTGNGSLPPDISLTGTFDQPGGPTSVNWEASYPMTVTGCAGGIAEVTEIAQDGTTGEFNAHVFVLPETPPGSGIYQGTLPPTYPDHGPAELSSSVQCLPAGGVTPAVGPAAGATTVLLSGSGFTGAGAVSFGGVPATGFSVLSDTSIQATVPAGTGSVPVSVTVGGTTSVVGQYAYQGISSVTPSSGPAAGGTAVTIAGAGLSLARQVLFGSTPAQFTQVSDTQLTAVSPPGTGTADITVVTSYGTTPVAAADQFTYGTAAAAGAKPASAPAAAKPAAVKPATAPAAAKLAAAPATANAATAPGIVRPAISTHLVGDIEEAIEETVSGLFTEKTTIAAMAAAKKAMDGADCETNHEMLKKLAAFAVLPLSDEIVSAVLAEIMPAALVASGGNPLIFLAQMAVWAVVVNVVVDKIVDKIIDAEAEAFLDQCGPKAPKPQAFNPNMRIDPSGTVLDTNGNPISGASVTILRSDLADGTFTPVDPASPGIDPGTNPETTKPDGVFHWDVSEGYYKIQALAPGCSTPGDPATPAVTIGPYPVPPPQIGLTITMACADEAPPPTPAVTGLSAGDGPPGGGTGVTVDGTGFTPASTVMFGSSPAASVTYLSPRELTAVSPAAASGQVDVTVHNGSATSATGAADRFFVGSAPAVTSLDITGGPTAGGTAVTLTGSGFTGAGAVDFGLQPATSFTVVSDTEIKATAPTAPAGPVDVRVLNPVGISAATASDKYTYSGSLTAAPAFTAATPPSSVAAGSAYSYTFTASGTPAPTYALAAGAPAWLTINPDSGAVQGTPSAGTTSFSFAVKAVNASGTVAAGPFTVTVSVPPPSGQHPVVYRDAGPDRVATGIAVSQQRWASGTAGAVVLATSLNFPDALTGGPLAAKKRGPLLLTDGSASQVDPRVLAEIRRVLPPGGQVFVLGGDGAVNPAIVARLRSDGYAITQFKGADRADTALLVARNGMGSPRHVVVATGNGFADALAAGPYAAGPFADAPGSPAAIVLSDDATLDPATAKFLAGKTVATVGAQAARAWPGAAESFAGTDRFDTAARVAARFTGAFAGTQVGIANAIATGTNPGYPDALTGGAFMAESNGPIVLVDGVHGILPAASAAVLAARTGNVRADIFGGTSVVPPALAARIVAILGGTAKF